MCSSMERYVGFRFVKKPGITAAILNRGRFLVMKRISMPFIADPGAWAFAAGGRKSGERYDDAAYREIMEETRIKKSDLKLLAKYSNVMKFDSRHRKRYYNRFYIFASRTREIKLNFENTAFRWAAIDDIANEKNYINAFVNPRFILSALRKALKS